MKVSFEWLSELINLDAITPDELSNRLTNVGLAVDAVESRNQGVHGVVVGEVVSCIQHPDAERLHVCEVNVGSGELLTIVCGAPNVAVGQKVPTALPGAMLPGGEIKKATLRGIESNGMLCSADEIGLETRLLPKAQTEGLFVLPADTELGADIVELLHLNDSVLEIDLTPNRSDCLSIRGLAYELSAILQRPFREDHVFSQLTPANLPDTEAAKGEAESVVSVQLDTERCSRYDAQVLDGARPTESPLWLQMRLLAMGIRPINCIVDVTNLVMLEWGQPLHAFDFSEVHGQTIVVRQAQSGESLVTLDGEERALTEDTIVIADLERAIGIAGVMGGENSEITEKTFRIVLESAVFEPASVRRTGQRLGLRSEAQQRFEKGIDPVAVRSALVRATQLMEQLSGASVVGGIVSARSGSEEVERSIDFSPHRCNRLLGTHIAEEVMRDLFTRLGFVVEDSESADRWFVHTPTRRPDLRIEADLIEEIGRLYGLDEIPSTLPYSAVTVGVRTPSQKLRKRTREVLAGAGMTEVFTYTLSHPSRLDALRIAKNSPYRAMIPLLRPMSEERTVMRTHMLPGLAEVAHYNLARGVQGGKIFEIGRVYQPHALPLTEQPAEPTYWAGLWFGQTDVEFGERMRKYDFYDAKGAIETWLHALGLAGQSEYHRGDQPWFHPGRSAQVSVGGKPVGLFGELHPDTASQLDIGFGLYAEFDLDAMVEFLSERWRVKSLPRYPGSRRDLAVVVDQSVPVEALLTMARELSSKSTDHLLEQCWVFDVYTGKGIPENQKSVAIALTYRSDERTLTDADVSELESRILSSWQMQLGAQLRA